MSTGSMNVTGMVRPCPECKAPYLLVNGQVQGRVVISRDPRGTYFTPHTDACTTKTEDHPLPWPDWGVGPYAP